MADRSIEDLAAGVEAATQAEPFLMSRTELIAHIDAHDRTGCGGYSTIGLTDGKRDVSVDYACRD